MMDIYPIFLGKAEPSQFKENNNSFHMQHNALLNLRQPMKGR
jgi:hypothetical protein